MIKGRVKVKQFSIFQRDACPIQDLNLLEFRFKNMKRKYISLVPLQDLHQLEALQFGAQLSFGFI